MPHLNSLPAVSESPADLLPHRASMLLLDRILGGNEDEALTETVIGQRHALFLKDDRTVGSALLIELMAQSIGICAGLRLKSAGQPPKVGFLLGTRHFSTCVDSLHEGDQVRTHVQCIYFSDGDLPSQFQCTCYLNEASEPIATANLTVFQPKDLSQWNN